MPRKAAAPKAKKVTPAPAAPDERPILYVRAGVTEGWRDCWVWDIRAKKYVGDVREANVTEGWFDQVIRDAQGDLQRRGDSVAFRRIRRPIRIDRRPRP